MPEVKELGTLPLGTRVRITSGTGTLVYKNFGRARVKMDGRKVREFDVPDPTVESGVRHIVALRGDGGAPGQAFTPHNARRCGTG